MNNELPLSERPMPSSSSESGHGRTYYHYRAEHYPFSSRRIVWAGALIIAGLVFLANTMGLLPRIAGVDQWNWIALGVGVLLLGEWLMCAVSGEYSHHSKGNLIMAGILIAIGLSGLVEARFTWPLILMVLGVAALFGALFRRI
jgi:hypothetical protein